MAFEVFYMILLTQNTFAINSEPVALPVQQFRQIVGERNALAKRILHFF